MVSNLTPLELKQLKTLLPELRMNFKKLFSKISKISELQIFRSNLFHLMTAEGKKEFQKKLCFILNRGILLLFLVLHAFVI